MIIDPSIYGVIGGIAIFLIEAIICYRALKLESKSMMFIWFSSCMVLISSLTVALDSYTRTEVSNSSWMLDYLYRGLDIIVFGATDQLGWILLSFSVLTWCMIGYQVHMESKHDCSYRECD